MNEKFKNMLDQISYHRMTWMEIIDDIYDILTEHNILYGKSNMELEDVYVTVDGANSELPFYLMDTNLDTAVPIRINLAAIQNHRISAKLIPLLAFCDAINDLINVTGKDISNNPAIVVDDNGDLEDHQYIESVNFIDTEKNLYIVLVLNHAMSSTALLDELDEILDDDDDDD